MLQLQHQNLLDALILVLAVTISVHYFVKSIDQTKHVIISNTVKIFYIIL